MPFPPKMSSRRAIFLSYARSDDEPFVRRLHADLTAAGFDAWFDRVSMPSRALTFHQEIRDAIAARERLILVVGPNALASDYVTQEWQFAYFAANKCVNPIVRFDGKSEQGARVDGYELIPEDLKLLHAEDFRDDAKYDEHLKNLVRQLEEPLAPVGKLVAVPELPPGYRAQPERLKALRDLLLIDLRKPVVVTGAAARVGLQGMGGIGKSVLANALAHHPEVRRAFRDNIFWITLGQTPRIEDLQRWLVGELGGDAAFNDQHTGKQRLRDLLADRAALLILDDVWQREHGDAFNVVGPLGRILATTRDADLVMALAAHENHYRVELPTMAEAEALLGAAAEVAPEDLPPEAREIIDLCGRLPLALALCGGMVHGGTSGGGVSWRHVLEALRDHDLEYLSTSRPAEEQHRNAWVAMDVSLRVLPEDQRERFAELAVFGLDVGAPEAAIATLWAHTAGMKERHSQKLLAEFVRRSLVQPVAAGGDGGGPVRAGLHDLLHIFAEEMAVKRFGSIAALHQRLLDGYKKVCPDGWPSGPNDGYFLQSLVGHLLAAGALDDAVALLTDLLWVETKCRAGLVFELQHDYRDATASLPEAQPRLEAEREQQAEAARYAAELIAYSRAWSKIRDDSAAKGESEPGGTAAGRGDRPDARPGAPSLPSPPATCRMWTEEEIETECDRIIGNPTRADHLEALARFVSSQCYTLLEFGERPGFVRQHAFNWEPAGPMRAAVAPLMGAIDALWMERKWPPGSRPNPRPAELSTLEGHSSLVASVVVTSDSRRAISSSADNTLRIWDLESGACLRMLEGYSDSAHRVSATPDGRLAVSAHGRMALHVWDLESGACLRTLEGHGLDVSSVSVTPDGRRAVLGSCDGTLRVWELESGCCSRTLDGHGDAVSSVSVSPDGRCAVSGSRDSTLRIWDLESGTCLRSLEGHRGAVTSVGTTPNGSLAVSGGEDESLRVWDLESGACLRVLEGHSSGVASVDVTPDGRRVVSGSWDKTLRVWDLESGACLRVLEGHGNVVSSVSVTPDGRRAVSGSWDKTLRVWDLESGALLRRSGIGSGAAICVGATADGALAVSGGKDAALRVWDLESGTCLRVLEGRGRCVGVTPDGRRAVADSGDKTLRVWDLESGACLRVLKGHSDGVGSVGVTPDGRCAISGSWDKTLRVWDLASGACLHTLEGHSLGVSGVSLTPDGLRAVSCSWDKTLRVWDLEKGSCLRTLKGHSAPVECVGVISYGHRVISGGRDATLRVWDTESGACLCTLEGHSDVVSSVGVTSDGRYALSGSRDATLRVWDLESGDCLSVYRSPSLPRAMAIIRFDLGVWLTTDREAIVLAIHGTKNSE